MDHKPHKPPPLVVSDCTNSQRMRRRTHSFSSSLLEVICQSMDGDDHHSNRSQYGYHVYDKGVIRTHSHFHHQSQIKLSKQNRPSAYAEIVVLQRGQVTKSIQNNVNAEKPIHQVHAPLFSSSSVVSSFSYSDSSSTHGPLSSSVSSYGPGSGDSSSSCFSSCSSKSPRSSVKEKITKAKLRAIKLYTELKKTKTNNPITPRCPLGTYLNFLFTPKKQNKASSAEPIVKAAKVIYTTPKKQPTSITKPKPPPHSSSPIDASGSRTAYNNRKAPMTMMRHDQDAKGREIFKKCQEKIVRGLEMREFVEETDGDDAESYVSSDLFELEFLMERGGEELPVFETTDVKINQAIANGTKGFSM